LTLKIAFIIPYHPAHVDHAPPPPKPAPSRSPSSPAAPSRRTPPTTRGPDEAFAEQAHEAVEQYVHVVIASYDAIDRGGRGAHGRGRRRVRRRAVGRHPRRRQARRGSTARDVYGQTEVYRFYGGPIDVEPGGLEGQINAWPMDEAYIDYVEGDPTPASSTTDHLPDDRPPSC
jgi:hypothetical protein